VIDGPAQDGHGCFTIPKVQESGRPALVGVLGERDFTNGSASDDARHEELPKIGSVASCS